MSIRTKNYVSNGFLLMIETYVRVLKQKLPEYSRISMQFEDFDETGNIESIFLCGKYKWSTYEICCYVGINEEYNVDDYYSDNPGNPLRFDVRVESDTERGRCCEYEFNHSQDFEETIDTAISWIEKELENSE